MGNMSNEKAAEIIRQPVYKKLISRSKKNNHVKIMISADSETNAELLHQEITAMIRKLNRKFERGFSFEIETRLNGHLSETSID